MLHDMSIQELPEASRLALVSARTNLSIFHSALGLDAELGQIVLGAREPLMAQIRVAWWREKLGSINNSANPNSELDRNLYSSWKEDVEKLVPLVDGWESLLVDPVDPKCFIEGRSALAKAIALKLGHAGETHKAGTAGQLWAYADLASRVSDQHIREWALNEAEKVPRHRERINADLRPLAVLEGLARRALDRGGSPMIGDRLSPLVALRLGILGV